MSNVRHKRWTGMKRNQIRNRKQNNILKLGCCEAGQPMVMSPSNRL